MNTEKFPEYREKVYNFIKSEIVPKYPEIKSCNMHVLPDIVNKDVEYLLELSEFLTKTESDSLKDSLDEELEAFCVSFEDDFFSEILLILWYKY